MRAFRILATAPMLAMLATVPASAQRDPAYAAARSAGQVGEQPDGYLGIVGAGNAALEALVDGINIRRREVYTERARTAGSTVEQMAFVAGCNLIMQTSAGEKYRGPDGAWRTRDGSAPVRDSRCL